MTYLIARARRLIQDTGSVLFTDDDDIQAVYDEDRFRIKRHRLEYDATRRIYTSGYRDLEGETGSWSGADTIAIYAHRGTGASEMTPDTFNLRDGSFEFTTAQADISYYLDAWVHDPYLAASKLAEELYLRSSITAGGGETGGAIVGRYDYERAARMFLGRAKPRRVDFRRVRSGRHDR